MPAQHSEALKDSAAQCSQGSSSVSAGTFCQDSVHASTALAGSCSCTLVVLQIGQQPCSGPVHAPLLLLLLPVPEELYAGPVHAPLLLLLLLLLPVPEELSAGPVHTPLLWLLLPVP